VSRDTTAPPGAPTIITIDRREAIRRVGLLMGGVALTAENAILISCSKSSPGSGSSAAIGSFTPSDVALLDEIADTILPPTKTPGAKAAGVGPFMAMMVTDCYEDRDQKIFRQGMTDIDQVCRKANGAAFVETTPAARLALLESLDLEQKRYMDSKRPDDPNHYFRMMKELTLLGYFTSEIGCTQAQRYVETPARYDPCTPYLPGQPSWAPHG
jgi:hypothetical protein